MYNLDLSVKPSPGEIWWWGYLHRNGEVQVKRWFGDHKDYRDDCEGNPNVKTIVEPFIVPDYDIAEQVITKKIIEKLEQRISLLEQELRKLFDYQVSPSMDYDYFRKKLVLQIHQILSSDSAQPKDGEIDTAIEVVLALEKLSEEMDDNTSGDEMHLKMCSTVRSILQSSAKEFDERDMIEFANSLYNTAIKRKVENDPSASGNRGW